MTSKKVTADYSCHATEGGLKLGRPKTAVTLAVGLPPIYRNKRLKFYYTSQIGSRPPRFVVMTNSNKGVHFSYQRYLSNKYREGLGLDKVQIQLTFKDKSAQREK